MHNSSSGFERPFLASSASTKEFLGPLLQRGGSVVLLAMLDGGSLYLSTGLAARLLGRERLWEGLLVPLLPVAVTFLVLVMGSLHLYDRSLCRRSYLQVALGISSPWLGALLASHYYVNLVGVEWLLLVGWVLGLPLALLGRWVYDTYTYDYHRRQWTGAATLLVGDLQAETFLTQAFPELSAAWLWVGRVGSDAQALGPLEDLPRLVQQHRVRLLVLSASALTPQLSRLALYCSDTLGVKLLVIPPPLSIHKRLDPFSRTDGRGVGLLEVRESRSYRLQYLAKRTSDILGAGVGVVLLSPLLLGIALLIYLEDQGPMLFRQRRLGLGGEPFWVWKFRTMVPDAEARLKDLERFNESEGGVLFKMKADPRVTRVGSFLRRTSLDELPQLFNVLQGHLSLVGPRPLQLRDCALCAKQYPDSFSLRLSVLPGVTGLWQVSGRSDVGVEHMLKLDAAYVENWSLGLDLRILWQTITVVLANKGAY
ncbi:sugar transferase [Anthocerotibacter panamensis]|uniref:sugar transferase n=1 Tax=Anthocerotibacter panamensis TaxID=2857077 RepID=UPI001C407659|nr:sugar transferase [Anthocerotibacter panamensis]